MSALIGKWDFVSYENLDAYMSATGVSEEHQKVARASKPILDISNSGDSWTIKTTVGDKIKDTTFVPGVEFESVALTGQALKCTVAIEGNKMIETQKAGGVEIIITREVSGDDELVSVMSVKGVNATIRFKRG
ncbi:hypothetical protein CHS0354_030417 [Potamilus streckersoni]|uniref:Uncharacterized protein n=1 Tax=Potamilus streckersoni TaxID=2493646 RepID=A0AAE0S9E0_9BIVA|nr:hypothetical protein CHS0354_030417 [Potamilus streckersoni]